MMPDGKGAVIMKVMEARKTIPPPSEEYEGDGDGDFAAKVREYCEGGKALAEEFLASEEGQNSPLRPKLEAVVSACEDLLSSLNEGGTEE